MDVIAILLAGISSFVLWSSDHQLLKWIIIIVAIIAWYLRRVVASIQKRAGLIDPRIAGFWANACVVSFWISVILSATGIIKAL